MKMERIAAVLFVVALAFTLSGCGGGGNIDTTGGVTGQQYVTPQEAVAYIAAIDAALEALPATQDNAMIIAWYKVARAGAVAFLARKHPEVLSQVPGVK